MTQVLSYYSLFKITQEGRNAKTENKSEVCEMWVIDPEF